MNYLFLTLLLISTTALAADLNKATTYKSNGMLDEAKRELVEVAYASESSPDQKAEALLLLGDVAQEQGKPEVANENWAQVTQLYATSRFATLAKDRMNSRVPAAAPAAQGSPLSAASVLVVSDPNHPWASGPLSASLASPTTLFEGSLSQAITAARQQPNIAGILEISLVTDSAFESGRVTCYRPGGEASGWKR